MYNLKLPFSRLPITQTVEIIAPTLMKAILKFCATNKLFELKNIMIEKNFSQICNLSAFRHILDLTSKCAGADWTAQNKFFQTLPNLSNLAFSNCSKNVPNVIQMALKWLFFFLKNCKNCLVTGGFSPRPYLSNCSFL